MKNFIGVYVTIGLFLISVIVGAGKLLADTAANQEKIRKVEAKVEAVEKENQELEKNIVKQTVALEYISKILEGIDKKLEAKQKEEK